jgi:hypothetical protein
LVRAQFLQPDSLRDSNPADIALTAVSVHADPAAPAHGARAIKVERILGDPDHVLVLADEVSHLGAQR